jgi:2-octaprenylphenol hydroxylase
VISLETLLDGYRVMLDNSTKIVVALMIGADGAASRVRQLARMPVRSWSYRQSAIVTSIETEQPHENIARQVFLPTGPLALLPLRNRTEDDQSHWCSLVWSLDESLVASKMALDEAAFCEQLSSASAQWLGRVMRCAPRYAFPLQQLHAVNYVGEGLALVGDAAHVIHPLAGQGFNLGLLDVAVLAEELTKARSRGVAPGNEMILRRYQRRRKTHNLGVMAAMEAFHRAFKPQHWMIHMVRNTGMRLFDRHTLFKRHAVAMAAGLVDDLPEQGQG